MAMGKVRSWQVSFFSAFSSEIRSAFSSPVIHWLGWCFPLILFILISSNFSEGVLLDLPVSVIDNDKSPLSKELIYKLNAGSHARLSVSSGVPEAAQRLSRAQDYALLYIPGNFEADLLNGKQPHVVMYYNALFYGSGLYATQDFSGLMAEINTSYRAIISRSVGIAVPPLASISLNYGGLFNASGSYIYYQQFAATIHLLQLFTVTCMIYLLNQRRTVIKGSNWGGELLGRLAPYTLSYTVLLLAEIALLVFVFNARVSGNPVFMLLLSFFYVIAVQSIGILLFTFTRTVITAYTLTGIFVGIALTFSGMAVPELSMPFLAQIITEIQPLTHVLNAMFDVFLRQVPSYGILKVCLLLLIWPVMTYFLVRRRLPKRLLSAET